MWMDGQTHTVEAGTSGWVAADAFSTVTRRGAVDAVLQGRAAAVAAIAQNRGTLHYITVNPARRWNHAALGLWLNDVEQAS